MKTGIIVEGGGMRGIYSSGVLDRFLELGIHFDYGAGAKCRRSKSRDLSGSSAEAELPVLS